MANTDFLKNGAVWKDCDGETIHAHGGCILKYGKYFYGMEKTGARIIISAAIARRI